jgi:hypothetical protein
MQNLMCIAAIHTVGLINVKRLEKEHCIQPTHQVGVVATTCCWAAQGTLQHCPCQGSHPCSVLNLEGSVYQGFQGGICCIGLPCCNGVDNPSTSQPNMWPNLPAQWLELIHSVLICFPLIQVCQSGNSSSKHRSLPINASSEKTAQDLQF